MESNGFDDTEEMGSMMDADAAMEELMAMHPLPPLAEAGPGAGAVDKDGVGSVALTWAGRGQQQQHKRHRTAHSTVPGAILGDDLGVSSIRGGGPSSLAMLAHQQGSAGGALTSPTAAPGLPPSGTAPSLGRSGGGAAGIPTKLRVTIKSRTPSVAAGLGGAATAATVVEPATASEASLPRVDSDAVLGGVHGVGGLDPASVGIRGLEPPLAMVTTSDHIQEGPVPAPSASRTAQLPFNYPPLFLPPTLPPAAAAPPATSTLSASSALDLEAAATVPSTSSLLGTTASLLGTPGLGLAVDTSNSALPQNPLEEPVGVHHHEALSPLTHPPEDDLLLMDSTLAAPLSAPHTEVPGLPTSSLPPDHEGVPAKETSLNPALSPLSSTLTLASAGIPHISFKLRVSTRLVKSIGLSTGLGLIHKENTEFTEPLVVLSWPWTCMPI